MVALVHTLSLILAGSILAPPLPAEEPAPTPALTLAKKAKKKGPRRGANETPEETRPAPVGPGTAESPESSPPPVPEVVAAAPAEAQDTVVVMALKPVGVAAEDAAAATEKIAAALSLRPALMVITVAELHAIASHHKDLILLGCEDNACIAELSKVANARLVLAGTLGKVGDRFPITLTLTDGVAAAAVGRGTRALESIDALDAALPGLLAEVFGWEGVAAEPAPRFRLSEGSRLSVAVFDLKPLGVSADVAKNLTQILAAALKQVEGTTVVSRDDIASMIELQAQKERFDCVDDVSCLAEIGGALGVDKLVVGSVGRVAEKYVVSLQLIDSGTSTVINRVSESFEGQESQLMSAVRYAGRQLLGVKAPLVGVLALGASEHLASVFIDDQPVGQAPMPPLENLSPGRHAVRIAKDGFVTWQSDVYIEPAATTALWAAIEEEPAPWYASWWFWTLTGTVVAGTATAIVLGVTLGGNGSSPGDVEVPWIRAQTP